MSQKTYSQYHARAFPGQVDGIGDMGVKTYKNSALDGYNTWTVTTPATVDDSETYSINVAGGAIASGGLTAEVETDANATQAELNAGLLAAVQATDIVQYFAVSLAANVITLRALTPSIQYTVTSGSNAATTNDLTLAETVNDSISENIPFGVFVGRSTAAPADGAREARLPKTDSNFVLEGVTIAPTHAAERTAIGEGAVAAYKPNEGMDVMTRTPPGDGVWVRTAASNITVDSTVYVDVNTAGQYGWVTATATDNLALPAWASISEGSAADPNGGYVVKLGLNKA